MKKDKKKLFKEKYNRIVTSRGMTLTTGVLLTLSGLFELFETVIEHWLGIEFGVGHGAVILGVHSILKSFVHIAEGSRKFTP